MISTAFPARRDGRQPAVPDECPDGPLGERLVGPSASSIGGIVRCGGCSPTAPLGAHLPLATGMVKAVDRAHEIGADAMQIFTDNPTAWKRRAEPPTELAAFRRRLREHDIGPVVDPCRLPREPRRVEPGVLRATRSTCSPRAARRARLRCPVRQRPHRLAPWRGVDGRHRAARRGHPRRSSAERRRRRRRTRRDARARELGRQRRRAGHEHR